MRFFHWSARTYWIAALLWAGLIFVLSHQSTLPQAPSIGASISSSVAHIIVYFVLAALITLGLNRSDVDPTRAVMLAVAIAVLYGISDEWHQSFVPNRDPSVEDLLFDLLGSTLGALLIRWRWSTRRRGSAEHNLAEHCG